MGCKQMAPPCKELNEGLPIGHQWGPINSSVTSRQRAPVDSTQQESCYLVSDFTKESPGGSTRAKSVVASPGGRGVGERLGRKQKYPTNNGVAIIITSKPNSNIFGPRIAAV